MYVRINVYTRNSNVPIVILQAPKDTTVFVNQKAKFTCETNGADYTNWRLNRTSGSDLSSGVVGDTNITGDNSVSTLTILARAVYNGTIVECVTGDAGHDPVMSDIVTLIIQGKIKYCYICCVRLVRRTKYPTHTYNCNAHNKYIYIYTCKCIT